MYDKTSHTTHARRGYTYITVHLSINSDLAAPSHETPPIPSALFDESAMTLPNPSCLTAAMYYVRNYPTCFCRMRGSDAHVDTR